MKQVALIFDYFKKAFYLNKGNRQLYKPQIALIILKTIFYIITGVLIFGVLESINTVGISEDLLGVSALVILGAGCIMLVIHAFGVLLVEAGLFNMYKSCLKDGELEKGGFREGVRKYAWSFFLVNLLIFFGWIVLFIPYVIIGAVTLTVGFALFPFVVAVFTTMWKVTIVMEDRRVIDSFKNSFTFAKEHFWPLSAMVMFQEAFSGPPKGGKSFNFNSSNWNSSPATEKLADSIGNTDMSFLEWYRDAFAYIKIGYFIAIPVISIAVIIISLIKMIFEIFFGLSIFVMYEEHTLNNELLTSKEVL